MKYKIKPDGLELTHGTVFRHRYKGEWEYCMAVIEDGKLSFCPFGITAPHDVVQCLHVTWKGQTPNVKHIVTLNPEDKHPSAEYEANHRFWWSSNPITPEEILRGKL